MKIKSLKSTNRITSQRYVRVEIIHTQGRMQIQYFLLLNNDINTSVYQSIPVNTHKCHRSINITYIPPNVAINHIIEPHKKVTITV